MSQQDSNQKQQPELAKQFHEFVQDYNLKVKNKLIGIEKQCMESNLSDPNGYANCMVSIKKDLDGDLNKLNFHTHFALEKLNLCAQTPIFQANEQEGIKYCLKTQKDLYDKILANSI